MATFQFDEVAEESIDTIRTPRASTVQVDGLFGMAVLAEGQYKALGVTVGEPNEGGDEDVNAQNERSAKRLEAALRSAAGRAGIGVKVGHVMLDNGRYRVRFQPGAKRAYTPVSDEVAAERRARLAAPKAAAAAEDTPARRGRARR